AVCAYAATEEEAEPVIADVYVRRTDGSEEPDVTASGLHDLLTSAKSSAPALSRVTFVLAADVISFSRAEDGAFVEDRELRGLHPMLAERMDLWRLANFTLHRAPAAHDVRLFHAIARDNPRDERLFALAEVRDL